MMKIENMKNEYENSIKIKGIAKASHSYAEAMTILRKLQAIFKIVSKDGYYHATDSNVLCICTRGGGFYLTVINGGSISFMKTENDYSSRNVVIKGKTIEEVVTKFASKLCTSYCCVVYATEQRSEPGHGNFEAMYNYEIKEVDETVILFDYSYSSRSTSSSEPAYNF